jgi:hypothetical protein
MIVKIKLNQNLSTPKGKLVKDQEVGIKCSKEGVPLDRFWRNRFNDSKIDNCLTIIVAKAQQKNDEKPVNKKIKNK